MPKDKPSVLVLDGPNLGALGRREPEVYGQESHDDLVRSIVAWAGELGLSLETAQHDDEGGMIGAIWRASGRLDALIVNPGGYSHSSIAVQDAMEGFDGPVIEVHLSQVMAREPERRVLVTARAADVLICGAGPAGYRLAMELVRDMISTRS